jgi:hypothetical protein
MDNNILDKYKNFVEFFLLESLKSILTQLKYSVLDIKVTKFDVNEHTGKYYPHFFITIQNYQFYTSNENRFTKTLIASKISSETEKFFPNTFNIGPAWITFNVIK